MSTAGTCPATSVTTAPSTCTARPGPSSASAATSSRTPSIRCPWSTATVTGTTGRTSTPCASATTTAASGRVLVRHPVRHGLYLVDNKINRYALGDRSGLAYADDGSLTILIQPDSPGPEQSANWLPSPKDGGFKLALRLYQPKQDVIDGAWAPPAVERVR